MSEKKISISAEDLNSIIQKSVTEALKLAGIKIDTKEATKCIVKSVKSDVKSGVKFKTSKNENKINSDFTRFFKRVQNREDAKYVMYKSNNGDILFNQ